MVGRRFPPSPLFLKLVEEDIGAERQRVLM